MAVRCLDVRRLSTPTALPAPIRLAWAGVLLVCGVLLLAAAPSAGASTAAARQDAPPRASADEQGQVDVVKVSGLLDPVLADLVISSVGQAERNGSVALVLQLNSSGAVISDAELVRVAERLHDARLPVAIWVGPSGAKARGAVTQLLGVVPIVGVAPGSTVGDAGDPVVPEALLRPAYLAQQAELRDRTFGSEEAQKVGVATVEAPVIVDLVGRLPGVPSHVEQEPTPHRVADVTPVFRQLPVTSQLMHTVASPAAAYLLVVIGLALIVFELFTAGVGVAGLVGAGSFALGCYGLWVLPTNWFAFVGLAVAFVFYAVDVQTGVPRFWTAAGTVVLVASSFLLLDGLSVPWLPLAVGIFGTVFFMLSGMPAMVRTRFSTPMIGREWLIGTEGEAVAPLPASGDGVVRLQGGLWPARATAGAIADGTAIRVVGVSGVLLEVDVADASSTD